MKTAGNNWLARLLSPECGPCWQFVKYGTIGVLSTLVQLAVFYLLASTCLKCLEPTDWAVRFLGCPAVAFTGEEPWYASRWLLAAVATAIGFTVANVFCWLMNRWCVFKAGKFRWYIEFALFYGAAASALFVALGVQSVLIGWFGMMTSATAAIEVVVSFLINFFVRKFFIFKG